MTDDNYELQYKSTITEDTWITVNSGSRDDMVNKMKLRAEGLEVQRYRDEYRIVKILPIQIVMRATVVDNGDGS